MNRSSMMLVAVLALLAACGAAFFYVWQDGSEAQLDGGSNTVGIEEAAEGPRKSVNRTARTDKTETGGVTAADEETGTEEASATAGLIRGLAVKARDKAPMGGLNVFVTTIVGDPVADARTGDDGSFKVGKLPVDTELSVKVVGDGYASQAMPGLFLTAGQDLDLGTLELSPATSIRGKVTSNGKNLANAHVALLPNISFNLQDLDIVAILRGLSRDDDPFGIMVTDDSGNFVFENVVPGEYAVAVTADKCEFKHSEKIIVREGAALEEVLIDLQPGCIVEGTIKTENGTPISDALVAVLREPRGMPSVFKTLKTRSDANGRFKFTQLGKGRYNYMIRAAGYAPDGGRIRVKSEKDNPPVEITLKKGITIRGTVTLQGSGDPIEGAEIITFENDTPISNETVSDADGNYELTDVHPEGRLALIVRHSVFKLVIPKSNEEGFMPFAALSLRLKGDEGPILTKDIMMSGGGTIKGRVIDRDTGQGVPNATVKIITADQMRSMFMGIGSGPKTVTDATGAYEVKGVKSGRFLIQVTADGYYSDSNSPASLVGMLGGRMMSRDGEQEDPLANLPVLQDGATLSGQDVNVIPGLSQSGTTVDPDGNPLKGASIRWQRAVDDNGEEGMAMFQNAMNQLNGKPAISDSKGRFSLAGMTRDTDIEILATHPSFPGGAQIKLVAAQVGKKDLQVVLQPGAGLVGRVSGPDGPLEGVKVAVFSMTTGDMMELMQEGSPQKTAVSDRNGRYEVLGLAGGKARVQIEAPQGFGIEGGSDLTMDLLAGKVIEQNFNVTRLAFISGQIVDAGGKPLRNVQLQLTPENLEPGDENRWRQTRWGRSRRGGEFKIDRVQEGISYKLRATWTSPKTKTENDEGSEITAGVDMEEAEGAMGRTVWTTLDGIKSSDQNIRIVIDTNRVK